MDQKSSVPIFIEIPSDDGKPKCFSFKIKSLNKSIKFYTGNRNAEAGPLFPMWFLTRKKKYYLISYVKLYQRTIINYSYSLC